MYHSSVPYHYSFLVYRADVPFRIYLAHWTLSGFHVAVPVSHINVQDGPSLLTSHLLKSFSQCIVLMSYFYSPSHCVVCMWLPSVPCQYPVHIFICLMYHFKNILRSRPSQSTHSMSPTMSCSISILARPTGIQAYCPKILPQYPMPDPIFHLGILLY